MTERREISPMIKLLDDLDTLEQKLGNVRISLKSVFYLYEDEISALRRHNNRLQNELEDLQGGL